MGNQELTVALAAIAASSPQWEDADWPACVCAGEMRRHLAQALRADSPDAAVLILGPLAEELEEVGAPREACRALRAAWRQTPVFLQQAEEHRRATDERRRHEAEMAARREAENVGGSV